MLHHLIAASEIDSREIECVHGIRQLHAKGAGRIGLACWADQPLCEVGVDAQVATFVGIGKRLFSIRLGLSSPDRAQRLPRLRKDECSYFCADPYLRPLPSSRVESPYDDGQSTASDGSSDV